MGGLAPGTDLAADNDARAVVQPAEDRLHKQALRVTYLVDLNQQDMSQQGTYGSTRDIWTNKQLVQKGLFAEGPENDTLRAIHLSRYK